jgi:hypothetical protein
MKSARRKPKEYSIFDLHPVTLKRRSPQSLGAVIDRKGKKRTSDRKKAEVKARKAATRKARVQNAKSRIARARGKTLRESE